MFKPVYCWYIKPKNHEKRIALKKEGTLIPRVLMNCNHRSIHVLYNNVAKTPNKIPKTIAIEIEASAKIRVLGKVSEITSETFFPLFDKMFSDKAI